MPITEINFEAAAEIAALSHAPQQRLAAVVRAWTWTARACVPASRKVRACRERADVRRGQSRVSACVRYVIARIVSGPPVSRVVSRPCVRDCHVSHAR